MTSIKDLREEADNLEARAREIRLQAHRADLAEQRKKPLMDRLVYAATSRCPCGAGMAYDPTSDDDPVFKGPSKWECGDILRYKTLPTADQERVKAATHTEPLPFAFYEIKSERQPSANGATTRPQT